MTNDDDTTEARHKQRMRKMDEAFEKRQAETTGQKGLIIVHTGAGKGKTTAALGTAFRALGHGMKVGIVQFIKGAIPTGEANFIKQLDLPIEMHTLGEGFTWKTQDRQRDIATAERAWEQCVKMLHDPTFDLLVFDELNVVLHYDYLKAASVLQELESKREMLHVVITGRDAPQPLIDLADLVSEMKVVKHPYKQGIMAQRGVEF